MFLGCVGVFLCEVPLLFLPCFPRGSLLVDSCSSGPGPQQTQAWGSLGSSEWGWHHARYSLPWGVLPAAWWPEQTPASRHRPPEAGLCPPAWAASIGSSPGSRPSSWLVCLIFHHCRTASQTPQLRRHPQWEDGAGSRQDTGDLSVPPSALAQAAAGFLVAEMRM